MILLGLLSGKVHYGIIRKIRSLCTLYPYRCRPEKKEYPQGTGQKAKITSRTRVADPHRINADPDPDLVLDPGL
jgi:hypothetical protein